MKKEMLFLIILLIILYLNDFVVLGNIIIESVGLTELISFLLKKGVK